ncbi:MAG: hypothetical protein P4K83_07425 [Terracidiphilus sp.]|nr:hypothetical protein [Terracidiphilus sp.]
MTPHRITAHLTATMDVNGFLAVSSLALARGFMAGTTSADTSTTVSIPTMDITVQCRIAGRDQIHRTAWEGLTTSEGMKFAMDVATLAEAGVNLYPVCSASCLQFASSHTP